MNFDRSWMYKRLENGFLTHSFVEGVENFIEYAISQTERKDGDKIKCPCKLEKCQNRGFLDVEMVKFHLVKHGFVPNYYVWTFQGETNINPTESQNIEVGVLSSTNEVVPDTYTAMVLDAARPDFNVDDDIEEPPNPEAKKFYDMLEASKQQLWPGCEKHSELSLVARLMSLKSENRMSEKCFDQVTQIIKEVVPDPNLVPDNFYASKKLMRGMGLPVEKIDCCERGCMIYWGVDSHLTTCKFCDHPRFKKARQRDTKRQKTNIAYKKMYYFPLTPRLQRLYASNATAKMMRWHAEHVSDEGVMHHPSYSPAWKHFSQTHPEFAAESRNVRLGLCTDGFQPFGQSGKQFSSWPVILTPYNLPPGVCMKDEYMFLTVLVPGPNNPKHRLDVYLQPLIAELKQLWEVGVHSYDISKKQNFQMRAALMWTISDFPAYSMLSGWSTAGKLACPHCMDETDAFTLKCSGKQSWFDNHRKFLSQDHANRRNKVNFRKGKTVTRDPPPIREGSDILNELENLGLKKVTELNADVVNNSISKTCGWKKRSIFWDLPYWSSNMIRHNLDVMHIEKNVFENIFNTVMNVPAKTKDTPKSREELNDYCRRPELKQDIVTGKYPKACYTFDKKSKACLCEWVNGLKFPDGYASNLGRCIDMKTLKLFGMKSHDCHVFMQRLIPIAFRELLPQQVWKALTELSLFFKDLTSTVIGDEDMTRLERDIPVILCKLERIFPPSFFDSMEHLPVHLPYEARIAGPVQYRWMYPFERYLRKLKLNVKNKARVEGSIANAYLMEEASMFYSYYFEDHVRTKHRNVPRNDDECIDDDEHKDAISIFKHSGRAFGKEKKRFLTDEEYKAARTYVLLNCDEVYPYIEIFTEHVKRNEPSITDTRLGEKLENEFSEWFKQYASDPTNNITNVWIKELAEGPFRSVVTYPGYLVNGYRFHTIQHGSNRATMNSGVCVKGESYNEHESDYYGRLLEVIRLEYKGLPLKQVVLFNCEWFDPTAMGTKVDPHYRIVEINHRRRFNRYEPFIIATQATQVYYCTYPSLKRDKVDWWAVCKIKARSTVPFIEELPTSFQEETIDTHDKECRWPEEEETTIKKAFMKQAAKLYSGMVSSWKIKWKDSKQKPDCVSEADWSNFLEYWNIPEVSAKAKTNSENRKKEVDNSVSKHVGGSKPAVSYFMELQKKKKGVKPTLFELQKQMHMRNDGTYSDEHSKNVCIEYERLINEASVEKGGDLTTEEKDGIYMNLVGGVKKQRVFGIGSMSSSYASDSRTAASFMEGTSIEQSSYVTEMMSVKNELKEEKEQRKALEEKMEIMQSELQQLKHVIERVDGSTRDHPL